MSGRAVGRVFERTLGDPVYKAVALCLAEHSNPDGEMSFPSALRIAHETELSERSVRRALAWLRKEKVILQTHGASRHRPATYRINFSRLLDLPLAHPYRIDLPEEESRPAIQTVQTCQPDTLTLSKNPQEEPSREDKPRPPKKPRPRDPMFDALAEVCHVDPATAGSSIARVKADLLKADPPYTRAEVEAFGILWSKEFHNGPPTLWQLRERIGTVRIRKAASRRDWHSEDTPNVDRLMGGNHR